METIGEDDVNNGFIASLMRLFGEEDFNRYDRKK